MARTGTKIQEPLTPEVVKEMPQEIAENTLINCKPTATIDRDEFASTEFIDPHARLPRIQALRGTSPQLCGYFIGISELAKAGFIDFDSVVDQLIEYSFESSGKTEQGLLLQKPRMLVCTRTPLLGFDRVATQESEQLVIVGHWQRSFKDDDNIGNCQFYEIILLNEDNQPLHTVPLSYVAKGANQATFSQEWQQLTQEVTNCHALANGIAARPKDARFKSLCVFELSVGREKVGQKQKSFACRVNGHTVPTMETWRNFFVGFNPILKQQVWEGLQPTLPPAIPEILALPGVTEEK
ncbi:DUF5895 domain-containing protein [Crocosphaera sp. Alani8]|uniref:DUF5895 domain-containing protein n=1 Tax=Crocosphaera sp. Alani8 TaxID=3038952 RepID=UPI00313AFC73